MINKTRFKGDFESLLEIQFLAPTGAQEILMFAHLSVRLFGSSLSRAVNLHLSRSEHIQRAFSKNSENNKRVISKHS